MKKILIVLLLCIGVYAQEHDKEYFPRMRGYSFVIESAVLMPDGEGFYTFSDGKIGIWGFNPIKLLDSFEIEKEWNPSGANRVGIHVSSDKKRLLFHSRYGLQLWDLKKRKLIKKVPKGKVPWRLSSYSNYGFVTLDYFSQLTLWDDKTLKILKQTNLPHGEEYSRAGDDSRYPPWNMLVGKNILNVNYYNESYFVDLKSLKIVETLHDNREERVIRREVLRQKSEENKSKGIKKDKLEFIVISKNRRVYFNKYKDEFPSSIWEFYMSHAWAYNLASTMSSYTNNQGSSLILYQFKKYTLKLSRPTSKQTMDIQYFNLWQHDNAWYVEDNNHFFNASSNARKYLKMERQGENSKPMSDAIFKRYFKTLNTGAL